MKFGLLVATAYAAGVALHLPGVAAYEDRVTFDLGPSLRMVPDLAPGIAVGAGLGLDDVWTVRAGFEYSFEPSAPGTHLLRLNADLLYLVDIVQWVPFLGPRLTLVTSVAPNFDAIFLVGAVGGLDCFMSRDFLVGLDVDWGIDPSDFNTQHVGMRLRFSWMFDV